MSIEVMKQALEFLEAGNFVYPAKLAEDLRQAIAEAEQAQPVALEINHTIEYMAEEAECVTLCLNDRGVPTHDGNKNLSLWGRVQQYAKPRFLQGMTTNEPTVSDQHIQACAKCAGIIGTWSTADVNERIVGFARVLLNDKAVQECFVTANTHLFYTAPPPRKPLTDEEIWALIEQKELGSAYAIVRAIEAAHGIKE